MPPRILMIVTSNSLMGNTGQPTGVWAEELAVPYFALVDAGAQVDLASPAGGVVPIDPASIKDRGLNEDATERFLGDELAQSKVASTRKAIELDMAPFDAVFFPGGHGTMWDLPNDAGVTRMVEQAFTTGKLIASVCHGAAGLVTARRPDGRSIVYGRRISSFTDSEEAALALTSIVPFRLESTLRELGGLFERAENWRPFAVRDGQLVTGQNPQSSALVAQQLLQALGLSKRSAATSQSTIAS